MYVKCSLRNGRLEVVGTRKKGRARRHARGEAPSPLACLPRARPFSLLPTTSKRLLRRLCEGRRLNQLNATFAVSETVEDST